MKSKYFIKKHCEATEMLCISTNRIQDYWYGNNPFSGFVSKGFEPSSSQCKLYGLSTLSEAEDIFKSMLPQAERENDFGQWQVTLEIVEVTYEE